MHLLGVGMKTHRWLLVSLLCCPGLVRAAPVHKIVAEFPTKFRTESPSFYFAGVPHTLAGGDFIYMGKGVWAEQQIFKLLDTRTHKLVSLEMPFDKFIAANARRFPRKRDKLFMDYPIRRLLFYEPGAKRAVFVFDHRRDRKSYLAVWHTDGNRIDIAADYTITRKQWMDLKPVFFDAEKQTFYLRQVWGPMGTKPWETAPHQVKLIAMSTNGATETVTQFESQRNLLRYYYVDAPRKRVLFPQYAEKAGKGPKPKGWLVELGNGSKKEFEMPVTAYGGTFSPDGRHIFLYAAQIGQLLKLDAESGRIVRRKKVPKRGFPLGYCGKDRLMLVTHRGVLFFHPKTFKRTAMVPMSAFYEKKTAHVEGSLVVGDKAFLTLWGDVMKVVEFPKGCK